MISVVLLAAYLSGNPQSTFNISCDTVREVVTEKGKWGAIAHARQIAKEHGIKLTWQNIKDAYKCLEKQ